MFAQVTFNIKQGATQSDNINLPQRKVIVFLLAENKSVQQIIYDARAQAICGWYQENDMTDTRTLKEMYTENLRFDILGVEETEPAEVKFVKCPCIVL